MTDIESESNDHRRKKKLDRTDREIIRLLQQDGRISNTDIAKHVRISEATVRTRLKRLIDEGFLQIIAVSDPIKLGFEIVGILRIKVDIKKLDTIIPELSAIKALWYIAHSTEGSVLNTEFVVKSLAEYNDLILNKVNKIDGVLATHTSLITDFIKRKYDWGTADD